MGRKRIEIVRNEAIAAVKAGKISARDAYATMDGMGALTRNLLEPYEAEAKTYGNGIWQNLTGSQKVAANNSLSDLRAAAAANAPKGVNGEKPNTASTKNTLASETATGYKLASGASSDSTKAKVSALEEERRLLTETSNRMGGLQSAATRIEQINREINTLMGQGGVSSNAQTITPEQAAASFAKSLEITPDQAAQSFKDSLNFDWNSDAGIAQKAKVMYPTDQKAQVAYINELMYGRDLIKQGLRSPDEAERIAMSAAQRWIDDPIRFITEPIDNLVNGDPTGTLAKIAVTGAGVSAGIGAGNQQVVPHVGMQGSNTPSGLPATTVPNLNTKVANETAGYNPPLNNHTQQDVQGQTPAPAASGPQGAMTEGTTVGVTPGMQPAPQAGAQGPYPTPNGGPPATNPPNPGGTPSVTGTTPPAAGGGNWWDAVGAREALAALGITVGAGGALIASKTAADGQIEAARIQADAAQKAIDAQKGMYDQTRLDQEPWRTAGAGALTDLQAFEQNNPDFNFDLDPGAQRAYTWRLDQGIKALENAASARGTLKGGNTLKAITEYGQGAASQEYDNAFNRYQTQRMTKLNRLQSLAGIGQTAVNATGQAGQNYTNNATNALIGGSQALAQGQAGAANASAQGTMGVANSLINGLSEYYQNQQRQGILNALKF